MKRAVLSVAAIVAVSSGVCPLASAQCEQQLLPGEALPGPDNYVDCCAWWDPDGPGPLPKWLVVGGEFANAGDLLGANGIAAFDGTQWHRFGSGFREENGRPGSVYSLCVDQLGRLIAGGVFASANGTPLPNIAIWDGAAWQPMGAGFRASAASSYALVETLLCTADGAIIAGGELGFTGQTPVGNVARWDGQQWNAMGSGLVISPPSGAISTVETLAQLPNGNFVAGGYFTSADGAPARNIAQWDGAHWVPMGGLSDVVYDLQALPNGDLFAGGGFNQARNNQTWITTGCLARWRNGAWEQITQSPLFNVDGAMGVFILLPDGDGFILGGNFSFGGSTRTAMRWSPSGTLTLVGQTGAGAMGIFALARSPENRLFAGGLFPVRPSGSAGFAELIDGSWQRGVRDGDLGGPLNCLIQLQDGRVVAYGSPTGSVRRPLSKLVVANGPHWENFAAPPPFVPSALVTLPDGELVAASSSLAYRLHGGSWQPWGAPFPPSSERVIQTSDGAVYLCGSGVWRWQGASWQRVPGTEAWTYVNDVDARPDGRTAFAGEFTLANGSRGVAVLGPSGWEAVPPLPVPYPTATNVRWLTNGELVVISPRTGTNQPFGRAIRKLRAGAWNEVYLTSDSSTANGNSKLAVLPGGSFLFVLGSILGEVRGGAVSTSVLYGNISVTLPLADGTVAIAGSMTLSAGGVSTPYFARYGVPAPIVGIAPAPAPMCPGETVELAADIAAFSDAAISWRHDGMPLDPALNPSATTSRLVLSPVSYADAGAYDCVVTNACGSGVSRSVTLALREPDLNDDGVSDQADVAMLINIIAGGGNPGLIDPDISRDGNVDQDDVAALLDWVAGGNCP